VFDRPQVAPSILSADFGHLRDQVGAVMDAGAKVIHVDVMDGHFVPPITIGPLVLTKIKEAGCRASLAINISTPPDVVAELVDELDMVLCMTINPGWGGQKLVESSYGKLERLRRLLPERVPIEVDGGIDPSTAPRAAAAGASVFVAGSYVFGSGDPAAAYREIAESVGAG
jgi:ribulose-phosphate 3-epimerase